MVNKNRYTRIGSKYIRKYGKTLLRLAEELNVSAPSITSWEKQGYDIFYKAANIIKGNSRLGQVWHNIQSRCGNPNDKKYQYYGGKGIKVKMDRKDLIFLWKRDKADFMKQPSIDRINSEGHYELSNCRFIEMEENRCRRYSGKE